MLLILDLHSTMDRFKYRVQHQVIKVLMIYIPLWIDLNINTFKWMYFIEVIYIPLWIDLNMI